MKSHAWEKILEMNIRGIVKKSGDGFNDFVLGLKTKTYKIFNCDKQTDLSSEPASYQIFGIDF